MSIALSESVSRSFLDTNLSLFGDLPHRVADLSTETVRFGRKELELALHEMPGLQSLRRRYGADKPLAGARITGSLHMTVQTGVLIETLTALGAEVRWASCNIFSTQDHAAAAVVAGPHELPASPSGKASGTADKPAGTPVFAWKAETLAEYWWCTLQALAWPGDDGPTLLVDDGGDVTQLVHLGADLEEKSVLPDPSMGSNEEEKVVYALLRHVREERGDRWFTRMAGRIRGVSEETTAGVHRLQGLVKAGTLRFPAINVNDSVTKSKFDNIYGCRHSLVDAINRATDVLLSGKRALVCGYGDVGKGSVQSLLGQHARVAVAEIDPICALQACMAGLDVVTLEDVAGTTDVFVTATGNARIIGVEHMKRMKHNAIVCNIGHFDNEIDIAGLEAMRRRGEVEKIEIKPQVHEWKFRDHSIIVLAEGRLVNLACATGHPSAVMSASFTNQVLAQMDLHARAESYGKTVVTLPKHLDEHVARLHLDAFGAKLTVLTDEQAKYIGVPVDGPFKGDQYRY